jgi:hypothetical protein
MSTAIAILVSIVGLVLMFKYWEIIIGLGAVLGIPMAVGYLLTNGHWAGLLIGFGAGLLIMRAIIRSSTKEGQ